MNEKTFNIRKAELLRDINKHPHKDELLNIMQQQLAEDCVTLDTNKYGYKLDIKRVTIKMPKDIHLKLKILAAKRESTLENEVLKAVKMYIQSDC